MKIARFVEKHKESTIEKASRVLTIMNPKSKCRSTLMMYGSTN